MSHRTSKRRRQGGFTLLELLLVMVILVVLASLSTFAILNMQQGAYKRTAFTEIQTLESACTMYKVNVGTFPSELNDLYQLPSGMKQSDWQGPTSRIRLMEILGSDLTATPPTSRITG